MQYLAERLDIEASVDAGVAFTVTLNSKVVTVEEAAAFVEFLRLLATTVQNALEAAASARGQDIERYLTLVPVVELRPGSLKGTIRWLIKKGKKLPKQAVKAGQEAAKDIATTMLTAAFVAGFHVIHPEEPKKTPPSPPSEVAESCAEQITPGFKNLAAELDKTGKPSTISVSTAPDGTKRTTVELDPQEGKPRAHKSPHKKP